LLKGRGRKHKPRCEIELVGDEHDETVWRPCRIQ
jgi:hypothetical protein